LITFTLLRSNSRLKYFGDFKLARLNKIQPTRLLSLPINHILPLILLFFKEKSELTECRFIDSLANLEAHKEVEHAIESLLDLTQAHALEVFFREDCEVGLGEGCYCRRPFEALCTVHEGKLTESVAWFKG
jgi:hypothetical protein